MHPEEPDLAPDLTPADRELERALKSLAPSRPSRLDPLAAAFAAGGRAARRDLRAWQSAAAAAIVIAAGSWLMPRAQPTSVPSPAVATAPPAVAASGLPAPPSQSLLVLQRAEREKGVDGLPLTDLPTVRNLRVSDLF